MHTVLEYTQKNTLQPQDIENLNLRNRCANLGKGFGGGTQLWKSIEQCIKSQEESHPNRPFLFLAFTDGEDSSSSQPVVDLLSTSSGLKFHLSVMGSIVSPNSELNRIPSINWSISEEIDIIVPFIELVNPTTPIPLPPMPVPVIVPPPVVVPVVWNNIITPCRVCNLEVYNGPNKCFFVKSDVHLSCSKCSLCHVQLGNNNYLKEHASVTMFALLCNSPNKAHKDEGKRLDDLRFKSKLPSRRLN